MKLTLATPIGATRSLLAVRFAQATVNSVVLEIARQVRGGHAVLPKFALEAVAVREGGLKRRGGVHVVAMPRAR